MKTVTNILCELYVCLNAYCMSNFHMIFRNFIYGTPVNAYFESLPTETKRVLRGFNTLPSELM